VYSFDRYFSVTRPLTYRARRTPRRAAIQIAGAWVVSVLLWTPWIWAWPYIEGVWTVPANKCFIQFTVTNPYITVITAFVAFYLPVFIMCVLYCQIYRATQSRYRDLAFLQPPDRENTTLTAADSISESQRQAALLGDGRGSNRATASGK